MRGLAPNAKIVLGGLSQVAYTTDTPEMAALRSSAKRIADQSATDNITFVDIWSAGLQPADFADDLHYTDAGAAKVAAVWFPAVRAAVDAAQ